MYERAVPGGALNLNSTNYPDHGRYGDLPLQGKTPTAEPGIEPVTSRFAVRSSDHQATRLVLHDALIYKQTTVETQNYSCALPDLWLTFRRYQQLRRYSVERLQNRMLVQTGHFLNLKRNINKLSQKVPPAGETDGQCRWNF
jgi:hypothetical protein